MTFISKSDLITWIYNVQKEEVGEIMKEKLFSLLMFVLELGLYLFMSISFKIPSYLILKMGIIWFLLLFISNHYKIQSTLVWEEIKGLCKTLVY